MRISTVINYCSLDSSFIKHCVTNCLLFSEEIVISVGTHLYDGQLELNLDSKLLEAQALSPKVKVIRYEWGKIPTMGTNVPNVNWHNFARATGFQALKKVDAVLFLDADEITEPDKFVDWLKSHESITLSHAFRFSCYWYFRSAEYQAQRYEDAATLIPYERLSFQICLATLQERVGLVYRCGNLVRMVDGNDGHPMFHHYSWVRSKENMLRKCATWNHKNDRDWIAAIEQEFQRSFDETCVDFVHGYNYVKVTPFVDIQI